MGDTIGVYYVQQLQGIPVISFNHEKYLAPVSAVGFHSKGIETVSVVEYQYERIRRIDQCVSYEQALETFRNYISENEKDIEVNGEDVYDTINYEYLDINKINQYLENSVQPDLFDRPALLQNSTKEHVHHQM